MKWRRKREDDLERELRDHIELEAAESGDRAAAKRDPIGVQITLAGNDVRTIVGVAKDMRYANVKDAPRDVVYRPLFQELRPGPPTFEIRHAGTTADALRAMRATVAAVDPE